eukprot:3053288-Rhodomonas_salina.1
MGGNTAGLKSNTSSWTDLQLAQCNLAHCLTRQSDCAELLLPGDIILRVDGITVQHKHASVLEYFLGGDGTLAKLEISRRNAAGKRTPMQVEIRRLAVRSIISAVLCV